MSFVVTIDFHDTLFRCDEWFALEVRDLPIAFFTWRDARDARAPDSVTRTRAAAVYRDLRREIATHGREDDAAGCLRQVCDRIGAQVSDDDILAGIEKLFGDLPDGTPLPGTLDALIDLRRRGMTLGVVSSAIYTPYLLRSINRAGMGELLTEVATSASTGYYKSRPEIYTATMGLMGASPERSLHVGDSLRYDVAGARAAGMWTAWLSHGRSRVEDDPQPDVTLNDWYGAADRIEATLSARGAGPRVVPVQSSASFGPDRS